MSNKLHTKEDIEELSQNPYVQSASLKGITYTDDFKEIIIESYAQEKLARENLEAYGLRMEVFGIKRIHSAPEFKSREPLKPIVLA